ncbi:hypothetical protein [Mycetocola sp. 2940]|uniref:hypothetical protein n=1 Tax=Mycetocola sp. 2940 TaxID=3156452 RepID=UPI00339A9414
MAPRRSIVAVLAATLILAGCTAEVPGPSATVTATATPSVAPRAPSDPIENFDALALCAARTISRSPFGDLPMVRTLDLDQVEHRPDGMWWVVIPEHDPNPIPADDMYPDGDSWSSCLLGGTIGNVEWEEFGGTAEEPRSPQP